MRRGVGVAAIAKKKVVEDKYKEKKTEIEENAVEKLQENLAQLTTKLEEFAAKHQNVLKTDPLFRQEFIQMCAAIGVDPLASSKGYWTEYLGVGTFYYHLAVQCIEIILGGTAYHGGVTTMDELLEKLQDHRSPYSMNSEISSNDVVQAFGIMSVLGKSCGVLKNSETVRCSVVFCVPEELSLDNSTLIRCVAESGKMHFTVDEMMKQLKWPALRTSTAAKQLLREGIVWMDIPGARNEIREAPEVYWFPGLFLNSFKTSTK